jgi:predicted dehydrogenase
MKLLVLLACLGAASAVNYSVKFETCSSMWAGSGGKFSYIELRGDKGSVKIAKNAKAMKYRNDDKTYNGSGGDIGTLQSIKVKFGSTDGMCVDKTTVKYNGREFTIKESGKQIWFDPPTRGMSLSAPAAR